MLSDAKKREVYDRGGEKAIKEGGTGGGGAGFTSPMDIFDLFFGGGSRMHRERKGESKCLAKLTVVFESSTEDMKLPDTKVCLSYLPAASLLFIEGKIT